MPLLHFPTLQLQNRLRDTIPKAFCCLALPRNRASVPTLVNLYSGKRVLQHQLLARFQIPLARRITGRSALKDLGSRRRLLEFLPFDFAGAAG